MASRARSFPLFGSDSTTTPDATAFLGIRVPLNTVAAANFPLTLVPTGVFPASTLCCRMMGNSRTTGEDGAGDFCWPSEAAQQNASAATCTTNLRLNIDLTPRAVAREKYRS